MSEKRYRTGKWHDLDNFICQRCGFATLDRGQIINHVRALHPTPAEIDNPDDPLAGVAFASAKAEETAREANLSAADFANVTPTGAGGYVTDDVKHIASSFTPEE